MKTEYMLMKSKYHEQEQALSQFFTAGDVNPE
jgi:hypothetical protein